MSENVSYSKAAGAYGMMAASTDQRALEGQILLQAAQKIEDLSNRLQGGENVHFAEVGEILDYNQKLWMLFVNDAGSPDHPLAQDIKNNIASLALFIFKRTLELKVETVPQKLKVLVEINRNIAAGLMKKPPASASPPPPPPAKPVTDNVV
jgi:flagellar protein FlaF